MAELVALDAEPPGTDVITKLEAVLALAKEGKISSVAIAAVERDGMASRWYSEAPSKSLLIGAVARLEAALIRDADCDEV